MDMMVTTTFGFEGYRIREYLGLVRGITVRREKNIILGGTPEPLIAVDQVRVEEHCGRADRGGLIADLGLRIAD